MRHSTLAFIFSADRAQVLLLHKQTPAWQTGQVNGVGGKNEPGETPLECIVRETREETGLLVASHDWTEIGQLRGPDWQCTVFGTIYAGPTSDAHQGAHEAIEWFPTNQLPKNVIPNLTWLIPLASDSLNSPKLKKIDIIYH